MARYVYRPQHPKASAFGFISTADLDEAATALALNAPIVMDRVYENLCATDGTDIGSRRRYKEYAKKNGLTHPSDFTNQWAAAAKEREAISTGNYDRKSRREEVERAIHQRWKP